MEGMSGQGWYPDPAGVPGRYRYWDGLGWTSQTSDDPAGDPATKDPHSGRFGWIIAIAVIVLVTIALVLWLGLRPGPISSVQPDQNSASPTVPSWNEAEPTASPPPIDIPDGGTLIDCPTGAVPSTSNYPHDGWLRGGGLKAKEIPAWKREPVHMGWVWDMNSQTDVVHNSASTRWFSMFGLGALRVVDGFDSPKLSAFQVMSCFATSRYYQGYTGRKDVLSKEITVNGKPGWHLRTEVYVSMPELPQVKGDWVDVVVVDTGNPESLGILISSATIGDHQRMDLVEAGIASLTTDQ